MLVVDGWVTVVAGTAEVVVVVVGVSVVEVTGSMVVVVVGEDVVDDPTPVSAPQAASNTSVNPTANHLVDALNSPHLLR